MIRNVRFCVIKAMALIVLFGSFVYSPASAGTYYVATTGNDGNAGTSGSPKLTLTGAQTAASAGDTVMMAAGTYNGTFTMTKRLVIMGAGQSTILASNAGGTGGVVNLTVSGLVNNPIVFKDLRVQPTNMAGGSIGTFGGSAGLNLSYIDFVNVEFWGTNTLGATEQERGFYVDNTSSLHYANFTNCKFNDLSCGWYLQKVVDTSNHSTVDNINVISCDFDHNTTKGIYAEKLSMATFNDCQSVGSGYDLTAVNGGNFNGGFDINLKAGTYSGIQVLNCRFMNNGLGAKEGTGLTVKGRDDGGTYGPNPASVSNVIVDFCSFTGNERAIRFGEPGKNNLGPTGVQVTRCSFINNNKTYGPMDGSAYGDVINQSQASVSAINNWWNSNIEANIIARKFGTVTHAPWLMHNTGDFKFEIAFNPPKPRVTDNYFNVEIKIQKSGDSISAIQFDMTTPRAFLVNNDVTSTLYSPGGTPLTVLNVAKNIIGYTPTTTTYRFALTPKNVAIGSEWFHTKMGSDTNWYATMKLAFKNNMTGMIGDQLSFMISNIAAQELNGAPIRATLKNTRIVRDQTIMHTFKVTGDINGSGTVNVQDLMLIINHILQIAYLSGPEFQEADLNRDGVVNIADAMLMINVINGVVIPAAVGSETAPLAIEQLNHSTGINNFDVKKAWAVYFTSDKPMQIPTNLANVKQAWLREDGLAMSILFDQLTDCVLGFDADAQMTGNRVGPASMALSVMEDLGSGPEATIDGEGFLQIFTANGALVYSGQSKTHLYQGDSGAYFYTITRNLDKNRQQVSAGKFVIVK